MEADRFARAVPRIDLRTCGFVSSQASPSFRSFDIRHVTPEFREYDRQRRLKKIKMCISFSHSITHGRLLRGKVTSL